MVLSSRDGVVHKIFVRKLHRTAQFCPHIALQKICKLVAPHRKYYRKSKYNG